MRSLVLSVVGLLGTMIYQSMPDQDLVPQPTPHPSILTAQRGDLPAFDLPGTTQEVKEIQAEVEEIAPKLGANDQLLQSIAVLSRQVGQIHGSMVTTEAVEEIVASRTGQFVTTNAMSDAIDEVKEQLKTAASDCDCKCEEKIASILKRLDALEAKCNAAPKLGTAQPAAASSYGSYGTVSSGPVVRSGGSTGSQVVGAAGEQVVTSMTYSEYSVPDSSYAVVSQPVVVSSGGCTGSVSYPVEQPYVQAASSQVVLPQSTREVRIVEPRQRRQVSTAEVPDYTPSFSVQSAQTCDMSDPDSPCAQAARAAAMQPVQAQPRQRLGSRIFGR